MIVNIMKDGRNRQNPCTTLSRTTRNADPYNIKVVQKKNQTSPVKIIVKLGVSEMVNMFYLLEIYFSTMTLFHKIYIVIPGLDQRLTRT